MLNQVVLVGRLAKEMEVLEKGGKKYSNILLAIPRSFKNSNGEYDTDFIEVVIFDMVAENTNTYCKKGDIIGVKGRLQSSEYEKEDGTKVKKQEVIGEKVTFLSSKKGEE
jgi:single-strand DNA-binding protein